MIQFNLLPDVKLEYIKTRKTKQRVVTIAVVAASAALGLLVMLFLVVNVVQKQHLNNLNEDIKKDTAALEAIPDLDKVLTIQNQLNRLPTLHDNKPVSSRFTGYLSQITPNAATISNARLDFTIGTVNISGNADTLSTINKFVDTLKFTEYTINGGTEKQKAFSEVVLSNFGKAERNYSYKIDFKFAPEIFSGQSDVRLEVPNIITTRSTTEKPSELFQQAPTSTGGQ